jgi:hypothetical protein
MDSGLYQTDPLLAFQQATKEHLAARRFLAGIPILIADTGDIISNIEQAVAKVGICIIVEPATAQLGYSGAAIQLSPDLRIIVWENVLVNRGTTGTKQRASAVALAVAIALAPKFTPTPPVVGTNITLEKDTQGVCIYSISAMARVSVTPSSTTQAG